MSVGITEKFGKHIIKALEMCEGFIFNCLAIMSAQESDFGISDQGLVQTPYPYRFVLPAHYSISNVPVPVHNIIGFL